MSQTSALIKVLKQQLKAAGKTYVDVAHVLELSEASVKRLFADENISLKRLEAMAQLAGLELIDLMQMVKQSQLQIDQLSADQESEIAADLELLMVALSVINGFNFEDLNSHFQLTEPRCIQKLAKLDRLKIIDLLPGNRIKLRVSPNFHWMPNGPIQRFFQEKVEKDFFRSQFNRESEKLMVLNAILTPETNQELQKRMIRWGKEFNELMQRDAEVPMSDRKGTTMVLALRQWQYSLLQNFSR